MNFDNLDILGHGSVTGRSEFDRQTQGDYEPETQHDYEPQDGRTRYEVEATARENLTTWKTWTGEGPQDQWPYPDKHTKSRVDGELANRIRYALGFNDGSTLEDVWITESKEHRGTFYTQQNFEWIEVDSDGCGMKFVADHTGSAFHHLLNWLDEAAPKGTHCRTCTCEH